MLRVFTIAAALIGLAHAASAATVDVSQGTVSINGAAPSAGSATVKLGDTVTAGPNGSASILYSNGCTARVASGQTVSVTYDDLCLLSQGANPGSGTGQGVADAATPDPSSTSGLSATQLATGAAVIGGAVAIGAVIGTAAGRASP